MIKEIFFLTFFFGGEEIITNLKKNLSCWIGFSNLPFYSLNTEGSWNSVEIGIMLLWGKTFT